ncbi:MAG: hypothetical protein LBR00_05670 [Clostridiales Family XIII bacterium]|jgi:hypothetical protein|nr:hypothetical protein [Clostridiales Family XIII bacterium]
MERLQNNGVGAEMRYLKWNSDVIGAIGADGDVQFSQPDYNTVVRTYTKGRAAWSPEEFAAFLSERIVSRDRRDIERILYRCGLSEYDVMRIAAVTRGMHPKDLLWLARAEDERYEDAMTAVFASVFTKHADLVGDSVDSPEGYNIKRYGVHDGKYGIYKQRISPLTTDVESEVAVCLLAQRMGVPCCPAVKVDADTVFSEFLYDFSKEYIVHFRRIVGDGRTDDEYADLVSARPQYKDDIVRMVVLDFVTRQDDRHLSNIAVKVTEGGEAFYPLFDNGRSLFYEDREDFVRAAAGDPIRYATAFGPVGTYHDALLEIAKDTDIGALVDLEIAEGEIRDILVRADFAGYRLEGAAAWIENALGLARTLL